MTSEDIEDWTKREESFSRHMNTLTSPLLKAAHGGDLEVLQSLIKNGADLEAMDYRGHTALHRAAAKNIDLTGLENWSLLEARKIACLTALIENGAHIESVTVDGSTALHVAARTGNEESLRLLLEKGADKEAKTKRRATSVHTAARSGHPECLRILLLAHSNILVRGTSCKIVAHSKNVVDSSRRRLKAALLALRYAGANTVPKSKNEAGDLIVSNEYLRSWFFLSQSEVREDVFVVLMDAMAKGKKIDYLLFRMAFAELGDYLISTLRSIIKKINDSHSGLWVGYGVDQSKELEVQRLCDPELVEENFGALIRNGIKVRFKELLKTNDSQVITSLGNSSSSSSTSSVKEPSIKSTSR